VLAFVDAGGPAPGGSFYVEGDGDDRRAFVEVDDERANEVLDASGEAVFTYSHDEEAEDRIIGCALPNLQEEDLDERSCTDEDGALPEGQPYGQDVVAKQWVTTLDGAELAFEISGAREVFFEDDGGENAFGAAGGPAAGDAEVTFVDNGDDTFDVCLDLALDNVEGTLAGFTEATDGVPAIHIHDGRFSENGPVSIAFGATPVQNGGNVTFDGCETLDLSDADEAGLLADLAGEPHTYYVNVHTDVWPGGVARGQLDGSWDGADRTGAPGDDAAASTAGHNHG
jgi:hypothetical protein